MLKKRKKKGIFAHWNHSSWQEVILICIGLMTIKVIFISLKSNHCCFKLFSNTEIIGLRSALFCQETFK